MRTYVVWVGGVEITDYPVTRLEAKEIADLYREDGYTDVHVQAKEVTT